MPPEVGDADRAVHQVLDGIMAAGKSGTALHAGLADRLEKHMTVFIKGEWDKSKNEGVSGKLGVP
ncbi:hypothetical protein AA0313_1871 [Acetobacter indonesiensis NRIC 0313]|uniref:Uncharacterized protein n=1 Tax=Acetobacter indonesiensis TaxID=104101 RepID=A0A6N3T9D4_9PROT|nr:hypothetical protein [Acetobacter indonesiensis]GAN62513.1 hypothetical protein Abin_008_019 [Acetobacter indonesiensis]GBQ58706.1 hypothetical protein AA0313_1871 [Acetobacter indonesiensis NRIC 0313]GEN04718.1 hypothetical protein AIN02nite_27430 [Acetobacter indonesiensis]